MTADAYQADLHRPALSLPQTYAGEMIATLRLAWPLVLTQLASMAIGVTDVLMLGRLGPDALAAAALGLSLFYMPMMFGFGMSSALSPVLAQTIGADPHGLDPLRRRAETTAQLRADFRAGFWAVGLTSLPAIAILLFARPLFGLLGQDPGLSATAALYVTALLPSLPFMLLIGVMRNLFSALSRPRPALAITLVWIGINALFNWMFIFGHLGAPALGVIGSGIATTCATLVSTAIMAAAVILHPATRSIRPFERFVRFDGGKVWRFVVLGFPIGVTLFFEGAVFNAALWLVGLFGADQLAGHQIAINVASLTFQIPLGIAFAQTVRVGYAAGANDWNAVRRSGHVGQLLAFIFMALTAFVMWTWPYEIAGVYLDLDDPRAQHAAMFAAQYLAIAAVFQLVDGQQVAAAYGLRGLKDTRLPMWIAAIAYWGIGFPACVMLGFWTPLEGQGVWAGLAFALLVAAALMTWRFEYLTRKHRLGADA